MERRLVLHEKLKNSKQKRMSIKQGDVLVNLNLKTDIIDPNIEISDKVLFMLEAFAEKQNVSEKTSKVADSTVPEPTLVTHSSTSNLKIADKSMSPTKRVRFEMDEKSTTVQVNSNNDNTSNKPSSIPAETKPRYYSIFYAKRKDSVEAKVSEAPIVHDNKVELQVESPIKISNALMDETKEVAAQQEIEEVSKPCEQFHCRLCRLKFNNQRALYEHVARIHGGKGGMFNSSLFAEPNLNETETDYFESQQQQQNSIKNKYNKAWVNQYRKKINMSNSMPHPNVAIRVAKVAYYNSKISTSNTATGGSVFKNQIFSHGGIRGNFFSQERLPLRSCKIKMKLKRKNPLQVGDQPDNGDDFLTHINNLSGFESVGKNLVLTTQNVKVNDSQHLSKTEIRQFFKSLLSYIPISNTVRLDDLIKLNEDWLLENNKSVSLRCVYGLVLDSKQFGITLFNLKQLFDSKSQVKVKMNGFKQLIKLLLDNNLVLGVGVVDRVYVAHQFKQHWVIQSFKNQKGRGYYNENSFKEESENENEDETVEVQEEQATTRKSKRSKKNEPSNVVSEVASRQFKPVCLVPRPWRYIDGLLNRQVLQKMLETIIIYLKTYPNSTLEKISNHFCPVLQPIMTLELLEMLEALKCVCKVVLAPEDSCDLFSDFRNGSSQIEDPDEQMGDEIFCYQPIQNAIFTIKNVFN